MKKERKRKWKWPTLFLKKTNNQLMMNNWWKKDNWWKTIIWNDSIITMTQLKERTGWNDNGLWWPIDGPIQWLDDYYYWRRNTMKSEAIIINWPIDDRDVRRSQWLMTLRLLCVILKWPEIIGPNWNTGQGYYSENDEDRYYDYYYWYYDNAVLKKWLIMDNDNDIIEVTQW